MASKKMTAGLLESARWWRGFIFKNRNCQGRWTCLEHRVQIHVLALEIERKLSRQQLGYCMLASQVDLQKKWVAKERRARTMLWRRGVWSTSKQSSET